MTRVALFFSVFGLLPVVTSKQILKIHPLDRACTKNIKRDSVTFCQNLKKRYPEIELVYSCDHLDVFYSEVTINQLLIRKQLIDT